MADEEGGQGSQESRVNRNRDRRIAKEKVEQLTKIRDNARRLEKEDKPDVKDLMLLMEQTDNLEGASEKMATRVAIVDAQVNCDISKLSLKSVKAQNAGQQQFTAKDFLLKLLAHYEQSNDNDDGDSSVRIQWDRMRADAAKFFDATPSCHFLANDMSKQVAKKARKARQVNAQRRAGEASQPTYGFDTGDAVKKNSEKRKRQIMETLKSDKRIVMADLVINPNSFGETVENIFACGVMVSEGYAGVKLEQTPPPHLSIEATQPREDEDAVEEKRAIVKLDYDMFQRMVQQRNIKDPHFKFDPEAKDATIDQDDEDEQSAAQTLAQGGGSGKKRRSS